MVRIQAPSDSYHLPSSTEQMKGTTRYHREDISHMLKRFAMMFVGVAVALIAGSASALTPCNLSGPYVATFNVVNPSLVIVTGTFTFTPPVDCNQPGTVSIVTPLGSVGGVPYSVEGNELSMPLIRLQGLIGRAEDGVADGFVYSGSFVNLSFGGTALRGQ
jgi:hypothetical protein